MFLYYQHAGKQLVPCKGAKEMGSVPQSLRVSAYNSDYTCFGVVGSLWWGKSGLPLSWVGEWYLQLKLLEALLHLPPL